MEDKLKSALGKMYPKKEESKESNVLPEMVSKLFHSRDVIHLAHLKATSYAQHIALNEYYDGVLGFIDTIVESGQCHKLMDITIPASKAEDGYKYLYDLKEYLCMNRESLEYDFQKNIVDEIAALIASTLYKLKFLK